MSNPSINKLLRYIEENIRITEQTSMSYLDSKGHINRLSLKQNQIIFGRRGSGKSLLLKSLRDTQDAIVCITINLEDYKDISFPNSIIHVERELIKKLISITKSKHGFFSTTYWLKARPLLERLKALYKELSTKAQEPDNYEQSIRERRSDSESLSGKASGGSQSVQANKESSEETETTRNITIDKLTAIKNDISDIKQIINQTSDVIGKDIFLILDDFYFIKKKDQPSFLDYFHRLSKNTRLYLKVATIKHRTKTYEQTDDSYIGIELGHDAQALNLDYSLEDFQALINFMKELLDHINSKIDEKIDFADLITDNAFRFLCLASGGVPRDFFTLFISLGPLLNKNKSISKPNVIEKAIENLATKIEAIKKDATEEESILSEYLQHIRKAIIEDKKWNCFLVSNSEIQNFPQINQAIKELVDLRLLHLVNANTSSAPSDGTRYSAYMVDIGLFPNSNPRKFQQIEPGQKDEHKREDKIRSSPKLNLEEFDRSIKSSKKQNLLELTE